MGAVQARELIGALPLLYPALERLREAGRGMERFEQLAADRRLTKTYAALARRSALTAESGAELLQALVTAASLADHAPTLARARKAIGARLSVDCAMAKKLEARLASTLNQAEAAGFHLSPTLSRQAGALRELIATLADEVPKLDPPAEAALGSRKLGHPARIFAAALDAALAGVLRLRPVEVATFAMAMLRLPDRLAGYAEKDIVDILADAVKGARRSARARRKS